MAAPSGLINHTPFFVPTHLRSPPSTAMVCTCSSPNKYPAKLSCCTMGNIASQPCELNMSCGHCITPTPLRVPTHIKLFLSLAMHKTLLLGRLPAPLPVVYNFHLSSPVLSIVCPVLKQINPLPGDTIHFWLKLSVTIC